MNIQPTFPSTKTILRTSCSSQNVLLLYHCCPKPLFLSSFLQLSPQAALGSKAYTAMATGEGVEDATIIEIIAHELRYSFVYIIYSAFFVFF